MAYGQEVDIRYYSPWSATVTNRRIVPLSVIDEYYLEAYCLLRRDKRRFRIDRIRSCAAVAAAS